MQDMQRQERTLSVRRYLRIWISRAVCSRMSMGLAIRTEVDEENARIRLELPNSLEEAEETQAQNALNALMLYFINLKARYQDFIEVMEV